jgi:hypothetical protein
MAVLKSHERDDPATGEHIALSVDSSFNCNMSPRLEEARYGYIQLKYAASPGVGELNELPGAAVAPRVSDRGHSGIRHVRHEASRGAPRPRAIGESNRARPRPARSRMWEEGVRGAPCLPLLRHHPAEKNVRVRAAQPSLRRARLNQRWHDAARLHFVHHSTRDSRPTQHTE